MAVRIKFDSTHNVIAPTFVLATRKGKKLGEIPVYNLVFKDGMNTCSELSFRVNKVDCVRDKSTSEMMHITPISVYNVVHTTTGYTQIGTITADKFTELVQYFKINNKLTNTLLRFVLSTSTIKFENTSFSYDGNYETLYLSKSDASVILLKVDSQGNVYINNAASIGLTVENTCRVEFSFDVPSSLIENKFWEQITDFKLVWAREWDKWFEIYVELDESNDIIKNVSAKALGEAELSQIKLYNIEINTENDIARDDYEPTVLFDSLNSNASLLTRILEKAPHYSIGHIDASIAHIQRTFTFDNITLYDSLQDIAQEIDCLFIFDNGTNSDGTIKREINVYDLESYCVECGERGNFLTSCSKCGSTNILLGYGENTNIYISTNNLADDIKYTTDNGSVKNCFKLEAGDDLMTATLTNCNPNGSGYIWYISDTTKEDMSNELVEKLDDYDEQYNYYQNEYEANVSGAILTSYNNLIDKYSIYTTDFTKIVSPIIGYPAIMQAYYNTIDFYYYLNDSLMPNIEVSRTTAALEASKLSYATLSPVAVKNLDICSSATATSSVLAMAKTIVDNRYQVKITDETTFADGEWTGIFVITNYSDEEDTVTSQRITVQINDNYEEYVKQRIEKTLNKTSFNDDTATDIVQLFNLGSVSFSTELNKYSLSRLTSFHDACQSCLDILIQQGISDRETWANKNPDLYRDLYVPYYQKLGYIEEEIVIREAEIAIIMGIKNSEDNNIVSNGMQTLLETEKNIIQEALNFEEYLGENLWLEFVAYRREDTYQNDNYISDGLNNSELFKNALEFIEIAKKDIYKSSTLQHSISATLKNLLVMKEFEPIVDYFEVGNWLQVNVDGKNYRLRLLDYEINFDSLNNIAITFSDVVSVAGGESDVESVLNQAASMATSYGAVSRQAGQGKKSNEQLDNWVSKGLALTKVKIVDSADNQNISWDNHGLLCKEYLPITDNYDEKQLKLINRGLYFTDDNWLTSRAGIGDFTFYNPETQQMEETYGVIADTLVGNLILSERVGVYNTNNSITMGKNGLTITTEPANNQMAFTIQQKTIDVDGNEIMIPKMYIDADGNLVLNGSIKINSSADTSVNTLNDLADTNRWTSSISEAVHTESQAIYSSIDKRYSELLSAATDQLEAYKGDIGQFMHFGDEGLTLGATSSVFKTVIDNRGMYFKQGDVIVSYINNNQLHIPNAVIENSLILGNFFFSPRVDGGVSLTWQGA